MMTDLKTPQQRDLFLKESEKTLWHGRRSFRSFLPTLFGLFFILGGVPWLFSLQAGVLGVALYVALIVPMALFWTLFAKLQSRYFVSNKRVLARKGILAKDTIDIELEHIRTMQVKQTVWGRILSFGTITIGTEGTVGLEVSFVNISRPAYVKQTIDAYRVRL